MRCVKSPRSVPIATPVNTLPFGGRSVAAPACEGMASTMEQSSAETTERDSTPKRSASIAAALKRFWTKAYGDGVTGLAGMVAYNLLLSLLPLTLTALFVFGKVVRSPDVQASVIRDVHRILPSVQGHS